MLIDKSKTNVVTGHSKLRRMSAVALPASAVTVSLFMAMQYLVQVDDFSPPKQIVYDVKAYMDVKTPPESNEPRINPPKPADIDPPPSPPALVNDIEIVTMPDGGYSGTVPADYGDADLELIRPTRVTSISDRTMIPITPPVPLYPRRAETLGLNGTCDVHLSVSTRGEPFNVQADCSDQVFERAAKKAVQKVKFAPQIRDGLPVTVTGVVYPLEFRINP